MTNFRQGTELQTIHVCNVDPTIAPGIPGGTPNLLLLRTDVKSIYYFEGPLDTDWKLVGSAASGPSPVVTLTESLAGNGTVPSPLSSHVFMWSAGVPWATLYSQMILVPGPKICLVQYDPAAPGGERQITNNGGLPQFISDVYFWALSGPQQSINLFVRIQDGFVLGGVVESGRTVGRLMSKDIGWDIRNSGGAVIFTPVGAGYAEFQLDGGYVTNSNPLVVGKVLAFLTNKAQLQGGSANGIFRPVANGSFLTMMNGSQLTGLPIFNSVGGPFNVTLDIDNSSRVSANSFTNATRVMQNLDTYVRDVGSGQRYAITVVAGVLTITAVS